MKKILIVEDEFENIENLIDSLEELNVSIKFAFNGKEALDLINKSAEKFDLIISDISMPQMNGVDFYNALCEMGMNLPFIFLSAHGSGSQLPENSLLELIEKPYDEKHLQDTIKRHLKI